LTDLNTCLGGQAVPMNTRDYTHFFTYIFIIVIIRTKVKPELS